MEQGIIMGIFDRFRRKTNKKAVVIGLDNSGKSTLISFLQEGKFVEHTPTMGKRKLDLDIGGTRISLFDMGGQENFRAMWLGELKMAKVVLFVLDKSAPERFLEAKAEFDKIITMVQENHINLLILGNKHDVMGAASLGQVIEAFDLFKIDNFEIIDISARTGYNIAEAFSKLYSLLTGKQIKKTKLASAISVYNRGGVPIINQLEDVDDIERKAIEGGFLVAITQFCKMKLSDGEETSIIAFESKNSGTFLVAKSKHYISSLLWREDLKVPMEQSKEALMDLLEHLETTCDFEDENSVAFHVEHYTTNMM
ncbi:MAG: ADP-ribosylation factor-like protein [Promethearchaeota archaeon]